MYLIDISAMALATDKPSFLSVLLIALLGMTICVHSQTVIRHTARSISIHQPRYPYRKRYDHDPLIVYYANAYADHYGVQRELVHAIITTESGWNPLATSNVYIKGKLQHAQGLMQLMPETGRSHGVSQPYSISDNIGGGVYYLSQLMQQFHGEMRLAVAAYYAGTKWIGRKQLSYSNPDVTRYVRTVRANYIHELNMHHSQQQR